MSYYTEKNCLAKFWNRDHTRLEWAKWVFHHPEQTEALVERLLGMDNMFEERLNNIEAINADQTTQITHLLASAEQGNVDPIPMEQLIEWLQTNPIPDEWEGNIESIPMEQLEEWLAQTPLPDGITKTQLQTILDLISSNEQRDDLQQQQINDLLNITPIGQEQLNDILKSTEEDEITSITKEQLDELLNEKGEDSNGT